MNNNKDKGHITLQLKKFDMKRRLKSDCVTVILGKRGTGKSYLVRDIMYHHRDIPAGVVISGTEVANRFFSHFIPPLFIHDKYNSAILSNFMKRQKKMKKRINNGEENIDPRAFLIFDDCLSSKGAWRKDENVHAVFMNGRHYDIFYLLTMQYPLGILPDLRTNIDFTFIFRENIMSNRLRIYEHYCGVFNTFEIFCSTLDQCTENYECLVVDNNVKSNKIEDQVFWYKAEDHGDFRIGPQSIWDYCEQNYVSDDDDDEEININTYTTKRKGPRLNVEKLKPE